jgi:hypothetical protein
MELTKDQIKKINGECPYDQGVFVEPYGVPVHIKEPVIYCRYSTGGYSGGSCWDDSDPQPYSEPVPKDRMKVLELVLKELKPNISYLDFKMISGLVEDNSSTEYEYYGNSTDWVIEYIKLSDLYAALEKLK